jgi:hypothetical protein
LASSKVFVHRLAHSCQKSTYPRDSAEPLFVGIDLHRLRWHVTVRTEDIELFSGAIPGQWEALKRLLERYPGYKIQAVYEAGYFGFWLHDHLEEFGTRRIVTPPSLIPDDYGNHVKTDRGTAGSWPTFWPRVS